VAARPDAGRAVILGETRERPHDVDQVFGLAALVGYRQHRPNLGNFEGRCPSVLFVHDRDTPFGAIDALRPDQRELAEAWRSEQECTRR
jgi:hypothetical protein